PATSQTASVITGCASTPGPGVPGRKSRCRAAASGSAGSACTNQRTPSGSVAAGKNTPEISASGMNVALRMAGAASALGMSAEAAKPRAQKHAAPSSSVARAPGNVAVTTRTLKSSTPTATTTTAEQTARPTV